MLILSTFAGAAAELPDAWLLVNPCTMCSKWPKPQCRVEMLMKSKPGECSRCARTSANTTSTGGQYIFFDLIGGDPHDAPERIECSRYCHERNHAAPWFLNLQI